MLAAFSFAIVGIAVFPYWVAVERLETERARAARRAKPLQVSMQCPRPDVVLETRAHPEPRPTR